MPNSVIIKDPEVLGGTPVFANTRVPFDALLDYVEGGKTLDECIPRKLKAHLAEHECRTVSEAGWAGKRNGELLRLAEGSFDVFLTLDKGVQYQQRSNPFGRAK